MLSSQSVSSNLYLHPAQITAASKPPNYSFRDSSAPKEGPMIAGSWECKMMRQKTFFFVLYKHDKVKESNVDESDGLFALQIQTWCVWYFPITATSNLWSCLAPCFVTKLKYIFWVYTAPSLRLSVIYFPIVPTVCTKYFIMLERALKMGLIFVIVPPYHYFFTFKFYYDKIGD